jgi:hypothetical protein
LFVLDRLIGVVGRQSAAVDRDFGVVVMPGRLEIDVRIASVVLVPAQEGPVADAVQFRDRIPLVEMAFWKLIRVSSRTSARPGAAARAVAPRDRAPMRAIRCRPSVENSER